MPLGWRRWRRSSDARLPPIPPRWSTLPRWGLARRWRPGSSRRLRLRIFDLLENWKTLRHPTRLHLVLAELGARAGGGAREAAVRRRLAALVADPGATGRGAAPRTRWADLAAMLPAEVLDRVLEAGMRSVVAEEAGRNGTTPPACARPAGQRRRVRRPEGVGRGGQAVRRRRSRAPERRGRSCTALQQRRPRGGARCSQPQAAGAGGPVTGDASRPAVGAVVPMRGG